MIKAVFTCGDINGIGPEIAVKVFQKILSENHKNQILFVCPTNVFEYYYKTTKSKFPFQLVNNPKDFKQNILNVLPLSNTKIEFGKITKQSGKSSYKSIKKSLELIKNKQADILITAPVSKEAINKANIDFSGHTELLAEFDKNKNYLMTFLAGDLKASLLTIHKPIKEIPSLIKKEKIISAVELLFKSAQKDFNILNPKIAILGLNPHAGENGLIGEEEIKIITPAIKQLRINYCVDGPFVPDAFWGNKTYKNYDFILGMYHDQILIPFKLLNFNSGVNYTAGLSFVRTSPDHGTAFDIAGKNLADPPSLMQSYNYAVKIFLNRKKYLAINK